MKRYVVRVESLASHWQTKCVPGMSLTFRYRVKDATAGKRLDRMAVSVNQVWNYAGGIQKDSRRLNRRWPSGFDLIK